MLSGDFLILLVASGFIIMAIVSIRNYRKYESNSLVTLVDIGSNLNILKKSYYGTFILVPIGLTAFLLTSGDAFTVRSCGGRNRCIEAHNITWWIFGVALVIAFTIINRVAKRCLEIEKSRSEELKLLNSVKR